MSKEEKNFMELVEEYREKRNFKPSLVDGMKAVIKSNPEAHQAYIKEVNKDR